MAAKTFATYTGRDMDSASGFYNYRARNYDAHTGRFTSEDPLRLAAGDTNLSRYVGNNPGSMVDPSGLWGFRGAAGNGRPRSADGESEDKEEKEVHEYHETFRSEFSRCVNADADASASEWTIASDIIVGPGAGLLRHYWPKDFPTPEGVALRVVVNATEPTVNGISHCVEHVELREVSRAKGGSAFVARRDEAFTKSLASESKVIRGGAFVLDRQSWGNNQLIIGPTLPSDANPAWRTLDHWKLEAECDTKVPFAAENGKAAAPLFDDLVIEASTSGFASVPFITLADDIPISKLDDLDVVANDGFSIVHRSGSNPRTVHWFDEDTVFQNMASSPIGQQVLDAAESNVIRLEFSESFFRQSRRLDATEAANVLGWTTGKKAKVYLPAVGSNSAAATTAIHEGIHALGVQGSRRAEALARLAETYHRGDVIDKTAMRKVLTEIREARIKIGEKVVNPYANLPWRQGKPGTGRTSTHFPGLEF